MAKSNQKTIYVLVHLEDEWDVVQWSQHPALAPHSGGKQKVSTAAGDVELRVPPLAERNYKVLGWAQQRIEQLHPGPDRLQLENMTDAVLLREALQMSLEYIALAEEGHGPNARSRYLAQQLRGIQQYTALYIKEENNG